MSPFSGHRSKRDSSDKKPSSGSEAGTVKLLTTQSDFNQLIKDLKRFDLSLYSEYHDSSTGLLEHESSLRKAVRNLQNVSKGLADKLEDISKLTARKKRRLDTLELLKKGSEIGTEEAWEKWLKNDNKKEENKMKQKRRAEEVKQQAHIRSVPQEMPYKGHWFQWSDQDEYFLKKYGTKGFKPEDMILGENGFQGHLKSSLENIKWHENPEEDSELISRHIEKNVGTQEVGTIR